MKYFFWKNVIWKETPSLNLEWETFTNRNLCKFTCTTNQMLKMLLVMHLPPILLKTLQTILFKTVTKGWISISLENQILYLSTHSNQQNWILQNPEKILIFFLSLINLILEIPQVRYQCYNILQLIVLNSLQRCWRHVNIKSIKRRYLKEWHHKSTDKNTQGSIHMTQYISNSAGSQKLIQDWENSPALTCS